MKEKIISKLVSITDWVSTQHRSDIDVVLMSD